MLMPKAYEGKEPYIFISYAHKDTEKVIPVIQALQNRGFRVWYDAGIEAGTEWREYIAAHLYDCTCFLAFISSSSMDSQNCRREIDFAIHLRKDPLAVYLEEDVKLSLGMQMQLGTLQAIFYNRHPSIDSFMEMLTASTLLKPCKAEKAAPAPVATPTPATPQKPAPQPTPQPKPIPKPTPPPKPAPKPTPPPKPKTPAELYHEGCQFYDKKQYKEAFPLFRKAAEQGHVESQIKLAYCYREGQGTEIDGPASAKWFEKAANQGNALAQYETGRNYISGDGVKTNTETAVFWCEKAAQQKYDPAAKILPRWQEILEEERMTPDQLYEKAEGLIRKKAYEDAKILLYKTMEKGHGLSALRLAELVDTDLVDEKGNVVSERNPSAAAVYYQVAADYGFPFAKKFADSCIEEPYDTVGEGIWAKHKYYNAKKLYFDANHWGRFDAKELLYAARAGHPEAQARLAALDHPERTEDAEVNYWREKLAVLGNADAMFVLGYRDYERKNYDSAVALFRKAADAGSYRGKHYLALCYAEGNGVPIDCIAAINLQLEIPQEERFYKHTDDASLAHSLTATFPQWYIDQLRTPGKYAKEQIHKTLSDMAQHFIHGSSECKNFANAIHEQGLFDASIILYQGWADINYEIAYMLGICYQFGHGIKQDYSEAARWYEHATTAPYTMPAASIALSQLYEQGLGVKKNWFTARIWRKKYFPSAEIRCRWLSKLVIEERREEFKI